MSSRLALGLAHYSSPEVVLLPWVVVPFQDYEEDIGQVQKSTMVTKRELKAEHLGNLISSVNTMRKDAELADVTLQCEKEQFMAHRLILSGGSNYFKAMFRSGMKEATTGIVNLQGVSAAAMEVVLEFIYSGSVEIPAEYEALKAILIASHLLEMRSLYKYCWQLLCEEAKLELHFAELLTLADHHDEKDISDLVMGWITANFLVASTSEQFGRLTYVQMKSLLYLLLVETSVDVVVLSILFWVDTDMLMRKDKLIKLLAHVNLDMVSADCLARLLAHDLVKGNPEIVALLLKAATSQLDKMVLKPKLFCFGQVKSTSCVSVYSHDNRAWDTEKEMPFPLSLGMAVVNYRDSIYFIGGGNSVVDVTREVLKYSHEDNTYKCVASLNVAKANTGSAVLHDKIYAIGGLDFTGASLCDVEQYNDEDDAWEFVAPTNTEHNFPRVVQVLDHILVVGSAVNSAVEQYSPAANQWTMVSIIPTDNKMYWPRVTVFQHRIYALNRNNGVELHEYNPVGRSWSEVNLKDGPSSYYHVCSVCDERKQLPFMFVADKQNTLYTFVPAEMKWQKLADPVSFPWNWWQTVIVMS